MTRVAVLAGEGEYHSDVTMRPIAEAIRERLGVAVEYRTPDVLEDVPDFPLSSFGSLEFLGHVDLLILYTRFRTLPDSEMSALADYLAAGGNLVALRTSTHAFRAEAGSSWQRWSSEFAERYLGSGWSRHHGHTSHTKVTVLGDHPVTRGLPVEFRAASWLYVNHPPADATQLLWGVPVDSETESEPCPVAWARDLGGQRIVYTSLGSERDLALDEVKLLITNAAAWALAGRGGEE